MPDTRKTKMVATGMFKQVESGGVGGEEVLKDQIWNHSVEVLEQVTITDECKGGGSLKFETQLF